MRWQWRWAASLDTCQQSWSWEFWKWNVQVSINPPRRFCLPWNLSHPHLQESFKLVTLCILEDPVTNLACQYLLCQCYLIEKRVSTNVSLEPLTTNQSQSLNNWHTPHLSWRYLCWCPMFMSHISTGSHRDTGLWLDESCVTWPNTLLLLVDKPLPRSKVRCPGTSPGNSRYSDTVGMCIAQWDYSQTDIIIMSIQQLTISQFDSVS